MHPIFKNKKIVFFDGDGTLYLGKIILPGAKELLKQLSEQNIKTVICTNNSSKTPEEYKNKLDHMGFTISIEDILISSHPALHFFKENKITNVYYCANSKVGEYFKSQGLILETESPQAILLTYDTELTYEKITKLTRFVQQGIPYFATHTDWVCPTAEGPLPDIGTFIAMIETTTNQKPSKTFGKPALDMILPHLKENNLKLEDAIMVGDRLYTDIAMGQNNELTTILTLTGETTQPSYSRQSIRASLVVETLLDLCEGDH